MNFDLMARYNQWANMHMIEDLSSMESSVLGSPTNANYGSIMGILNHLMLTDELWLYRFSGFGSPPKSIDKILFNDLSRFKTARKRLDAGIISSIARLGHINATDMLNYTDTEGAAKSGSLIVFVSHFFNHQTHHRGQVQAVSAEKGLKIRDLDLFYFSEYQYRIR